MPRIVSLFCWRVSCHTFSGPSAPVYLLHKTQYIEGFWECWPARRARCVEQCIFIAPQIILSPIERALREGGNHDGHAKIPLICQRPICCLSKTTAGVTVITAGVASITPRGGATANVRFLHIRWKGRLHLRGPYIWLCVCVCVCVYEYICTYTHIYTHIYTYIHIHVYIYFIYTCIQAPLTIKMSAASTWRNTQAKSERNLAASKLMALPTHTQTQTHTHHIHNTHTRTHTHTQTIIYICNYCNTYTHTHAHTRTHTHARTHTHTHTYTPSV